MNLDQNARYRCCRGKDASAEKPDSIVGKASMDIVEEMLLLYPRETKAKKTNTINWVPIVNLAVIYSRRIDA